MIAIMTERKKKETGAAAGTAVRREQTRTSFLKRWFHWSSSRTRRNSKVDQATPPSSPLQAPNSALKRRKSDKDVFVHNNNNNPSFAGDPAAKSATLPTPRSTNKSQKAYFSPRHSIRVRTPNNSPITAICTNTTATNTFTSIAPKRQPGHHHSPITLGNALSTPHSPRHRRPPRNAYDCLQPKQAASFWDISPTAETAAAALRSNKKKQLVRSNSIGNSSSYHDYSEPYHWLFPSSQNEHSFLPPPALPPRPPHIAQEPAGNFRKYMNVGELSSISLCNLHNEQKPNDYMSISTLTLNPTSDVSDYQQPIVTQRTPLPPCIRHRKMDQTLRSIRATNKITKDDEDFNEEEEEEEEYSPSAFTRNKPDNRRITVVILDDDRTLKV